MIKELEKIDQLKKQDAKKLFSSINKSPPVVLSADIDGLTSLAILHSFGLNLRLVGLHSPERILIEKNISLKDCLFLDIEILNSSIVSVGNHLQSPHHSCFDDVDIVDKSFSIINPNKTRNVSYVEKREGNLGFKRKYPYGTCHYVIELLEVLGKSCNLPDNSKPWLYSADGTLNTMFKREYVSNTNEWIDSFFTKNGTVYNLLNHARVYMMGRNEKISYDVPGFEEKRKKMYEVPVLNKHIQMVNSAFNININTLLDADLVSFEFDTNNCSVSKKRCLEILRDTKCVTAAIHKGGIGGFSYSLDTKNCINV